MYGKACEVCGRNNRRNAWTCAGCGEDFPSAPIYRLFRALATLALWGGGTMIFILSSTVTP